MNDDAAAPPRDSGPVARKARVQVLLARRKLVRSRAWVATSGFWNWKYRPAALGVAAIILGIVAVISSISAFLQGPTTAEANAAEWLSAISTFWGAIASGLAAIGTAGALLIAAFGYKHQVEEKERQEAERRKHAKDKKDAEAKALRSRARQVSILPKKGERFVSNVLLEVHNGTSSPIRNVMFLCLDSKGTVTGQTFSMALPAGQSLPLEKPRKDIDRAWVRFQDVDDKTWKIHLNGHLEEV